MSYNKKIATLKNGGTIIPSLNLLDIFFVNRFGYLNHTNDYYIKWKKLFEKGLFWSLQEMDAQSREDFANALIEKFNVQPVDSVEINPSYNVMDNFFMNRFPERPLDDEYILIWVNRFSEDARTAVGYMDERSLSTFIGVLKAY
jgi:hypothetical protein